MLRKVKASQPGRLYLTGAVWKKTLSSSLPGFQSFNPGDNGELFCEKVTELARQGVSSCFIFAGTGLKQKIYGQLPSWIRQLKMDHPQLDFHIRSGRLS